MKILFFNTIKFNRVKLVINKLLLVVPHKSKPRVKVGIIPFMSGFSLVELMLVIGIVGILAMIGVPSYKDFIDKKDITIAEKDITEISGCIEKFFILYNRLPNTLNEGNCNRDDPWKTSYVYLNISLVKGKGKLRKDKNLTPINSDYDLYSKGEDGRSVSPLTAKDSRDDIIRANNGGFIGLAADF